MKWLDRIGPYELICCETLNQATRWRAVERFFALISRLGDGVLWYTIMALLPFWFGEKGLMASAHMLSTAVLGLALYRVLKHRSARPRPYRRNPNIVLGGRCLDEYSFPSGHTLHACNFTLVLSAYFPAAFVPLMLFTLLTMMSRVVLGLHYPSDVTAGALIGSGIALLSLSLLGV